MFYVYCLSLKFVNTHGSNFSIHETIPLKVSVYLDDKWEEVQERN
jgi:hypothetical protein